jgi:LPS export ABC transporter protein LptC
MSGSVKSKLINSMRHGMRFLLFVVSSLLIWSCQKEQAEEKRVYRGPKSELLGIDMVYSDSGRTVVHMITDQQITTPTEDRIYPKEMKLWFYDKLGNVSSEIRGDSAHFFRIDNSYKLMGHVVINNVLKGELMKTDEFTWLPDEKRIFTSKPVSIKTRTDIVHGVGFDAAQDFSTYSLRRVSNSVLTVDELPTN